jgi:hypothetical protein
MGLVDEALFGYEVVERMPTIVKGWVETYRERETQRAAATGKAGQIAAGSGSEPKPK